MSARYLVGDVQKVLATLPESSVDLVLSSPPFLALRSYLPADHPDKGSEIGSESTPGEFLDVILDVVEACARVLTPHGSLVFEFGDTYAGGGNGPDKRNPGADHEANAQTRWRSTSGWDRMGKRAEQADQPPNYRKAGTSTDSGSPGGGKGWPLDKSLTLIPESFAWALAYGRNPWTGRETEPWRIRNFCPWVRPNPPVGALGDKFRPGTSYLTVACKARDRWFDLDSVRTERPELAVSQGGNMDPRDERDDAWRRGQKPESGSVVNAAGAPPLDWFKVSTEPYPGAHYATWPRKLALPFIESMCPRQVCNVCGEPSRRLTATSYESLENPAQNNAEPKSRRGTERMGGHAQAMSQGRAAKSVETLGWTVCGHGDDRNGMVLEELFLLCDGPDCAATKIIGEVMEEGGWWEVKFTPHSNEEDRPEAFSIDLCGDCAGPWAHVEDEETE